MTGADFLRMSAFSCGVEASDTFFQHELTECVSMRYLSAYCAYLDNGEIIAAFTLMNDALMISSHDERADFLGDIRLETAENIADFLYRQTSYPAVNIGHLGVSREFQGKGVGGAIIDLVAATYSEHTTAGCQFITVDAINNSNTIKFYSANLFSIQTDRDSHMATRRMYRVLIR